MNRWDEIKCKARDVASNVHADPAARDAMAAALIELCGLMIAATGKGVAVEGESNMNEAHEMDFRDWTAEDDGLSEDEALAKFQEEQRRELAEARALYSVGEEAQSAVREAVKGSLDTDPERYARSGLKPVWAHVDRRPEALRASTGQQTTDPAIGHHDPVWVVALDADTGRPAVNKRGDVYLICGLCGIGKTEGVGQAAAASNGQGRAVAAATNSKSPCPECNRTLDHKMDCSRRTIRS